MAMVVFYGRPYLEQGRVMVGRDKEGHCSNLRLSHLPGNFMNASYTTSACYIFGTVILESQGLYADVIIVLNNS